MFIDFHTHIFHEKVQKNRRSFFSKEPEFKLLYESPKSKIVGVENLIQTMDEQNVELSVVFGFPWRDGDIARENNDYIIQSVEKYPDRLKGFACFDVLWEGAPDETKRCLNEGLSGVGELAFYLSGIDEKAISLLEPIMKILRDNGNLPCMIHTNEPVGHKYPGKTPVTIGQIYNLAKAFPENKLVLAHWGGGVFFYNIMKKDVKTVLKNIWFDTAASPFLYDPSIYKLAVDTGIIDKVLLGTDYPLLKAERYIKDIEKSGVSNMEKEKILKGNAFSILF
ncbi:MAG: amidohydrolase family protein [Desulfobacteraceae bacterium]|nr:amidohydrolase family protein [Desulfobacteraceae bacterium]